MPLSPVSSCCIVSCPPNSVVRGVEHIEPICIVNNFFAKKIQTCSPSVLAHVKSTISAAASLSLMARFSCQHKQTHWLQPPLLLKSLCTSSIRAVNPKQTFSWKPGRGGSWGSGARRPALHRKATNDQSHLLDLHADVCDHETHGNRGVWHQQRLPGRSFPVKCSLLLTQRKRLALCQNREHGKRSLVSPACYERRNAHTLQAGCKPAPT